MDNGQTTRVSLFYNTISQESFLIYCRFFDRNDSLELFKNPLPQHLIRNCDQHRFSEVVQAKKVAKINFFYDNTIKSSAFRYKEEELVNSIKNMRRQDNDAALLKQAFEKKSAEFRDSKIRCQSKIYEMMPYTAAAIDSGVTLDFIFETRDENQRRIIKEIRDR